MFGPTCIHASKLFLLRLFHFFWASEFYCFLGWGKKSQNSSYNKVPMEPCPPKWDLFWTTQYNTRRVKYFVPRHHCDHFKPPSIVPSAPSVDVAAANTPALWPQLAVLVSSLPHLNSSAHTTANSLRTRADVPLNLNTISQHFRSWSIFL